MDAPTDPSPAALTASRRSALVAGGAVAALAAVYPAAVRTQAGQEWDENPILGRWSARSTELADFTDRLDQATLAVIAVAALALLVLLVRRRDPLIAFVAAGALAGANGTTQALKQLLGRPPLIDDSPLQSFPSGHTTAAASLVLVALVLVPAAERAPAGLLAILGIAVVAVGVVAGGFHRASDAIGAVLVCLAWAAAAQAVLCRLRGVAAASRPAGPATWAARLVVAATTVAVLALAAADVMSEGIGLLGGRGVDEGRVMTQAVVAGAVTCAAVALLLAAARGAQVRRAGAAEPAAAERVDGAGVAHADVHPGPHARRRPTG